MHRFITKAVVTASALCLTVAALAGCTKKPDAANNNAVVGITQEPGIFDPHTVVAAGDKEILFNVYEGLFKYDYEGNLNPCLATDVEISSDASVYTFTIRDGVKFHDGSDLDATFISKSAGLYLQSSMSISSLTASYASSAILFSALRCPSVIELISS